MEQGATVNEIKVATLPPSRKKRLNGKTVGAVVVVLALITVGVILGSTGRKQETYNGSRDIMRMLETADGIRITLYTTGIYADDGKFQETDIVILPKDFSKSKTELVFDAKAEFRRGNTTVTHIVKDSKAYVMEEVNGTTESYCGNVPEMPNLDKILDTILNAQAVDEESEFFNQLSCPKNSHRLIHAVWEGLDYFYCFDTSGAQLGSFLGPAMIGKVEYLSQSNIEIITAPSDLECDTIDFNAMSQSPDQLFEWEREEDRRLQLAGISEVRREYVRFGTCESPYFEHSGNGGNTWNLATTVFSKLNLDFSQFWDLAKPSASFAGIQQSIQIRRLDTRVIIRVYKYQHDGFPCIYIHGAGVSTSTPQLLSTFNHIKILHVIVNPSITSNSTLWITVIPIIHSKSSWHRYYYPFELETSNIPMFWIKWRSLLMAQADYYWQMRLQTGIWYHITQ